MRISEQPIDVGNLWSNVFATVALIAAGVLVATSIFGLAYHAAFGQLPYPWWNTAVGILVVATVLGGFFFYVSGRIRAIRRE